MLYVLDSSSKTCRLLPSLQRPLGFCGEAPKGPRRTVLLSFTPYARAASYGLRNRPDATSPITFFLNASLYRISVPDTSVASLR